MSNASLVNTAVNRLISQSNAVGRLAQDSGGFAAVVAAFESPLYEWEEHPIFFVSTVEKCADVSRFAQLRAGKGNG